MKEINPISVEHSIPFTSLHFDFTKHELHIINKGRMLATVGIPIPKPGQILRVDNIEGIFKIVTHMEGVKQ